MQSACTHEPARSTGQGTTPVGELDMNSGWLNPFEPPQTIAQGKEPDLWWSCFYCDSCGSAMLTIK